MASLRERTLASFQPLQPSASYHPGRQLQPRAPSPRRPCNTAPPIRRLLVLMSGVTQRYCGAFLRVACARTRVRACVRDRARAGRPVSGQAVMRNGARPISTNGRRLLLSVVERCPSNWRAWPKAAESEAR